MDLSGKRDVYGTIELVGTIRDAKVLAVLRIGKGAKTEKVRLKKILKPHC